MHGAASFYSEPWENRNLSSWLGKCLFHGLESPEDVLFKIKVWIDQIYRAPFPPCHSIMTDFGIFSA